MKPLLLRMQAFGCYQQDTRLDFSLLENRLFLITGATGGGKTTLLDAICFALYCRATGGRRTWSDMRSLDAPFDTPTVVEFSFSLAGERYRFRRSLRMHRVRGTDRVEQREEHICWQWREEDWSLLESGAESKVREAAQRLLGLTCEQFSQVIVLPQGEFRRLLLSNSTEKARILQALFQTERWERLTRGAQHLADELKEKLDKLEEGRAALLRRENAEDLPQLERRRDEAQARRDALLAQTKALEQAYRQLNERHTSALLLEEQFQRLEGLQEEHSRLIRQEESVARQRLQLVEGRRREKLYPYFEAVCRGQQERREKDSRLAAARQALSQGEEALRQAEKEAREIPSLREQAAAAQRRAATLEAACGNARRLERLHKGAVELETRLGQLEEQRNQARQAAKTAEQNVQAGEQYMQTITLQARKEAELTKRVGALEAAEKEFAELAQREKSFRQAKQVYESAEQSHRTGLTKLEALQKQLEADEAALRRDRAAQLAQSLRENEPCPVCGALHHPSPAVPGKGIPLESLEALRAAVREEETLHAARGRELAAGEALLHMQETAYAQQRAKCGESGSPQQVQRELAALREELAQAQTAGKKLPRAEKLLRQRRQEQEQARKTAEQCEAQMQEVRTQLAQAKSGEQALRESLPADYSGLPALEQAFRRVSGQAASLEQRAGELEQTHARCANRLAAAQAAHQAAEAACRDAGDQLAQAQARFSQECSLLGQPEEDFVPEKPDGEGLNRLEAQIKAYDRQLHLAGEQLRTLQGALQQAVRPDIGRLTGELQEAQESSRRAAEQLGGLQQACESLARSFLELCETEERFAGLQTEYSRTQRLAQLMSGGNIRKVPLRMFVLGIMLDDIVSRANRYFATLSSGRYALARPEQLGGGRGYSGLELKVMDAYCGGLRPVETLSGGELFLASLSLAFGLSDVVQSYSGGVRLDSIFIDEGFGTLDQDTLDTAMRALEEIHQTGRTVGIISHVNELKSRIGAKILVTPLQSGGSTAKIVL